MRATLEQLKAMSQKELQQHWMDSKFPFDLAAGCGHCLTQHAFLEGSCHPELTASLAAVKQLILTTPGLSSVPHEAIEELYALRLFYDSLYPQPVEPNDEASVPMAEQEGAEERVFSYKPGV